MKTKITLLCILITISFTTKAQSYVTISDTNFVTWLQSNIPSAMNGNQMDTSSTAVTTLTSINIENKGIANLNGIQYFDSLRTLDCGNGYGTPNPNTLTSLPQLPITLDTLICQNNPLNSLPLLPNSLQNLNCEYTHQLTSLPTLPSSLQYLKCSGNQLTSLPILPNSLVFLECNYNQLTSLPILPDSLEFLSCLENLLISLPNLPSVLNWLLCTYNQLSSLPPLPNSLANLACDNNQLTHLPTLPDSLYGLYCTNNQITSLPTIPNSIQYLFCSNNNITCFPHFPDIFQQIDISGNPFTCLPNYISVMDAWTSGHPLCVNGDTINNPNGCNSSNCNPTYTTLYDTVQNTFTLTIDSATTNMAISYHWDFGDGTSSTLANPSHIYTVDSLYNVCMKIFTTPGDSCIYCHILGIDSSGNIIRTNGFTLNVQYENTTTGIFQNNSDKLKVSIYPNPFTSQTTISFNKEMKNSSIKIVDVLGKKINEITFSGKQLIIEKGSMKAGVYFLQVVDENKDLVNRKIIIQ